MYKEDIILSDIETVKNFVTFANKFDFPVNLISERHIVNGKSIMGIFSLDLSQPLQVEVDESFPVEFKEQIKTFRVKKEN